MERPSSREMDEILGKEFKVLDHGYIRVIDYMGDDASIVQAARVSYGKGTKRSSEDRALIRYLMRNSHTSPFEMAEIKIHVKLPIFVARQWIRHRTANVNEYSARYSVLDNEFYIPELDQLREQSSVNRQGRGSRLSAEEGDYVRKIIQSNSERSYDAYLELMNQDASGSIIDQDHKGIARELARMGLSINFYTQWYWKCDLHNLMHFIRLRIDPHAQYEIRAYAEVLLEIVRRWVPLTHEAFLDYRLNGAAFSNNALGVIRKIIKGEGVSLDDSGLTASEWRTLQDMLGL